MHIFNNYSHEYKTRRIFELWIKSCYHGSLELVHQTWTLSFASSFDHNFQPNDNQTFIVYAKSTLGLYRKGLCGFFLVLGFALEEKLHGKKCCKYFGPEGVYIKGANILLYIKGAEKMFVVCASNQTGSSRDTATIIQYTNVTGPNQSDSSWDRPPATPSWGRTQGGTVSGYSTKIPTVL